MEVDDDDMFVVIIGEEECANSFQPIEIKQELEESCDLGVEELLDTAEKHGEYISMCKEEEHSDSHYEYQYMEDGIENTESESEHGYSAQNKTKRWSMLKPEQRKSYVKELIRTYPELGLNEEKLIKVLYEKMKSVERPEVKDYFVMNGISFECVKCGVLSDTMPAAARHYQEKHGSRYLICYACGVDFRSTTNLYKHEKRCNAPDAVPVLKARAMYVGLKGRSRPFLNMQKITRRQQQVTKTAYPCKLCSAVFWSKTTLKAHIFMHNGSRPYQCKACPAAYTSKSALSRHLSKHENKEYICDHCNRSFKVKATLIAHLNTHLPQKKFGCDRCGRRYAQKMALTLHVNRAHRRLPPPCACQICTKRYPRMSLLKTHMLREHGMILMTRNMFFKSLPMMKDMKLKQAMIVMKEEVNVNRNFKYALINAETGEVNKIPNNEYLNNDSEAEVIEKDTPNSSLYTKEAKAEIEDANEVEVANDKAEENLSQEVLQYIQKLQQSNEEGVKYVIIQDGNIVNVGDDTVLNEEYLEALNQAGYEIQVKTEPEEIDSNEMFDEPEIFINATGAESEVNEAQYKRKATKTQKDNSEMNNMRVMDNNDKAPSEMDSNKPNEMQTNDSKLTIEEELERMHSYTEKPNDNIYIYNKGLDTNTDLDKQNTLKVNKVAEQQLARTVTRSAAKNERRQNAHIVTRSERKLAESVSPRKKVHKIQKGEQ